jgi:hypothetical protein
MNGTVAPSCIRATARATLATGSFSSQAMTRATSMGGNGGTGVGVGGDSAMSDGAMVPIV